MPIFRFPAELDYCIQQQLHKEASATFPHDIRTYILNHFDLKVQAPLWHQWLTWLLESSS